MTRTIRPAWLLLQGDALRLPLPDGSVDAIVTDPPYGLKFMGKAWDHGIPGIPYWIEALRVCKPGAYMFAFGGTRTYHRMTCAIEDAGWEVRDCVLWLYGSGFPKGRSCLKPAYEPIVLCRKPGPMRALQIDSCRVGMEQTITRRNGDSGGKSAFGRDERVFERINPPGRWPSNLIHDGSEEVLAGFPETKSGHLQSHHKRGEQVNCYGKSNGAHPSQDFGGDSGSAARFFYTAKASKHERGHDNSHPTVKPIALLEYLYRLITPPGGIILDQFAGSGSAGLAALKLGRQWIGAEKEPDSTEIARRRINRTPAARQIQMDLGGDDEAYQAE